MFCNQCEQTAQGTGCTIKGVCGKSPDIQSLQETLLFALKGIGAYAYHARQMGEREEEVDAFMHEAMFKTLTNVDFSIDDMIATVLAAGRINLKAMEMLDRANTKTYGDPVPVKVQSGTVNGPGILVTGHDLPDLEELLKQTEGKGINIYTHGEMLPAHGYPKLKKYKHLVGNYGSAWQKQKREFAEFGGPILATSNCIQIPGDEYRDRLFTIGITAIDGVQHIKSRKDMSAIINRALEIGNLPERNVGAMTTGFHHTNVLALAPKLIELINAGKIKHIFLIGGCDGAKASRNYFNILAEKVPRDCLIITLACGKYRFNDRDFGDIDGIPRLLDLGQCNNSYSAILVAAALADAFKIDLNKLPLSLVVSWYEQKAVAVLLTLLHLGIRNIRLGPSPPAFLSPNVMAVIQEKYALKLIGDPDEDLREMLAGR